jgi:hypothetical protein
MRSKRNFVDVAGHEARIEEIMERAHPGDAQRVSHRRQ